MTETGQPGHLARLCEQLVSGFRNSSFRVVSDLDIRASDFPKGPSSLGQRIRITDSAGTKWTVWDGLDILLEHDGTGGLLRRYTHGHTAIPGVGSLIAIEDAEGNVYFYLWVLMGAWHP